MFGTRIPGAASGGGGGARRSGYLCKHVENIPLSLIFANTTHPY